MYGYGNSIMPFINLSYALRRVKYTDMPVV